MNNDDRFPCFPKFLENGHDCPFGGGIYTLEGFIHDVNVCILPQCPRQEYPLLLAAGQLADLAVVKILHADLFQSGCCPFLLFLPRPCEPAQSAILAHQYGVHDCGWKIPIHAGSLGHIPHLVALLHQRFAEYQYLARHRLNQSHDRFDHGCLARAIGTHDGHEYPPGHFKVNVPQHRFFAICYRQVIDPDGCCFGCHWLSPPSSAVLIVIVLCRTMPT